MTLSRPVALALLALAPAPLAQFRFDFITYDRIALDIAPPTGGLVTSWGLLVNTGTEPIELDDWRYAMHFAEVGEPATPPRLDTEYVLSPPVADFPLMPGEAIGSNDPICTALLLPGETLANRLPGSLPLLKHHFLAPSPTGIEVPMTLCLQMRDQRVDVPITLVTGPGASTSVKGLQAIRIASTTSNAGFASVGAGCPLAGADLGMRTTGIGALNVPWPPTGQVASTSGLPVLGNAAFTLRSTGEPFFGIDAPWLVLVSAAPVSTSLLGCPVHVDLSSSFFANGTMPTFCVVPGVCFPLPLQVHLPIPALPALAGTSFWTQLALVLPSASSNGLFSLTDGYRITIGTCP